MKKIISLIVALAMTATASVSVFAANVPADADITVTANVEDTGVTYDEFHNYKITWSFSGLGTLEYDKIRVGMINIETENADIVEDEIVSTKIATSSDWVYGKKGDVLTLGLAVNDITKMYPTEGTINSIENAIVTTLWAIPDTELTFSVDIGYIGIASKMGKLSVATGDKRGDSKGNIVNVFLGEDKEPAELALDTTLVGKYDNGYIWNAAISLDEDNTPITAFTAEFSAAGETPAARSISNISELNKYVGEGSVNFYVGLNTRKTLNGATFTVTDGLGASVIENADVTMKNN